MLSHRRLVERASAGKAQLFSKSFKTKQVCKPLISPKYRLFPKSELKRFKTTGTMVSGIAPTALANLTMTGSLPYNFPPNMTPTMGARDASQSLDQSSGYPSPRHLTQPFSTPPAKHVLKTIVFHLSLFTSRLLLLKYYFK
jgi:hypothetical protein